MAVHITADKIESWRQTGLDLVGDPNERDRARTLRDITAASQRSGVRPEDALIALHEAMHVVAFRATGIRLVHASRQPKGPHMGSTIPQPLSSAIWHLLERRRAGENVRLTPSQSAEVEAHLVAILAPIPVMRAILADPPRMDVELDRTWKELPQLIAGQVISEKTWRGLPEGLRTDLLRATGLGCEVLKEQMPGLCQWAIQRGGDLTLANWVHVQVVVGALLELETLDGQTIDHIVEAVHTPLFTGRLLAPTTYKQNWQKDVA